MVPRLARKRVELPAERLGCFRARGVEFQYGGYGSRHGEIPSGTGAARPLLLCWSNDRIHWESLTIGGIAKLGQDPWWDQAHGGWFDSGRPELTFFTDDGVPLFYLSESRAGPVVELPEESMTFIGHIDRPEENVVARALHEFAMGPKVEDVCDAAQRCEQACLDLDDSPFRAERQSTLSACLEQKRLYARRRGNHGTLSACE